MVVWFKKRAKFGKKAESIKGKAQSRCSGNISECDNITSC